MAVQTNDTHLLTRADAVPGFIPEKFAEVREGELYVMTPARRHHNRIASRFERLFEEFTRDRPELDYGGDNDGFLLRDSPLTLLSPDASLHRARSGQETTWLEFAPEIVVEVLSPSNSPADMTYKRRAFFDAGTEQFWVVDAEKREIAFYHRDGRVVRIWGDKTIEAEGIAAGLRIALPKVFGA